MMIKSFEPGDGTRYLVAFEELDSNQQVDLGLHGSLFSFGTGSGPLTSWVFQNRMSLNFGYYESKMVPRGLNEESQRNLTRTLCAGFYALAEILGVIFDEAKIPLAEMYWNNNWREQLHD